MTAKVWAITRREYIERVRSKWFLISTFGLPVIVLGLALLPGYLLSRDQDGRPLVVGTVDSDGRLQTQLGHALDDREIIHDAVPGSSGDEDLSDRLLDSNYDAFLVLPPDVLDSGTVRLLARGPIGGRTERSIREALGDAVVAARLSEQGLADVDAEALVRPADLQVIQISQEGAQAQEVFQALAIVFAVVTYMMFLVYGQLIVRAVLEEKTSDIVEVMVSSVRPWEMMLGKMFGVGAVGLTQIAIWALVVGLVGFYGVGSVAAILAAEGIDVSLISIPWALFGWALVFFLLGYFLYAGLFLAAGAMLSNEQDAQQVVTPLVIVIVIGFVLVMTIIESPDSSWALLGSLVPVFSPMIMPARLAITHVPAWELLASLALLILGVLGAAWLAGRIYRIGILMKGKRPNLPELARWVRHG